MKKIFLFCFILHISMSAFAEPRVNNGGGGWACQKSDGTPNWIRSADLFEIQSIPIYGPVNKGFYKIHDFGASTHQEILASLHAMIKTSLPDLQNVLNRFPVDLETALYPVNEPLDIPLDLRVDSKPKPDSCPQGLVRYVQLADFLIDGHLLISSKVWNSPSFSETEKAAILLHEEIYYACRKFFGDETSERTRFLVGLIFSETDPEKLRQTVDGFSLLSGVYGTHDVRYAVPLAPIAIRCGADVSQGSHTFPNHPWRAPLYGAQTDFKVGPFSFHIETSKDYGSPTLMRIVDRSSHTTTELDMLDIDVIFNLQREIHLHSFHAPNSADLNCWSSTPQDGFPL